MNARRWMILSCLGALLATALPPAMALQIALIASVCGVLAAVAPARRAAALDPAQAIRM